MRKSACFSRRRQGPLPSPIERPKRCSDVHFEQVAPRRPGNKKFLETNPGRFAHSRDVPAYLGLTPRRHQSGSVEQQRRISKAGNKQLRSLLVQWAQYLLGRFGPDSDLKRWGSRRFERGGKNSKRRAIVAVARKLSVLLHRLWVTGDAYHPLYNVFITSQSTPSHP